MVNNALPEPLGAEHGLSFWIEYADTRILFDTGQSPLLLQNAERLGIDLSRADFIVISHGHYDHTGALSEVLRLAPRAVVCLHPAALKCRFSCHPGKPVKNISVPAEARDAITGVPQNRIRFTAGPTPLAPGLLVTGAIPRTNDFEDTGGPFFLDPDARTPDPVPDDQALLIDTPDGLAVVLGCAHAGVVNTLSCAAALSRRPVRAIAGGLHLAAASSDRLSKTLNARRTVSPRRIAPCHCTGEHATETLRRAFPSAFHDFAQNARLTL